MNSIYKSCTNNKLTIDSIIVYVGFIVKCNPYEM